MYFVAYYRVSTKQQGDSGLGLEAQKQAVMQLVTSRAGELLDSYVEIESGGNNERPELEHALTRCTLSGATLVVSRLDRLSRDVGFIDQLQKSAVSFVCADMPQANNRTIGLLAVLAQHERVLISKRTKEALQSAKERGVKLGNPNLQKVRNNDTSKANEARKVSADAHRALLLKTIDQIESKAGERLSYRAIAKQLNDAKYKTPRGKKYTAAHIWQARNY